MKMGPKYKLPFKRRLKKQTNYKRRLGLLISKKPRLILRKSLKYMRAQIVDFDPKGDKVLVSASSQDLKRFGWSGSTSNIPTAYLTGLLVGRKALKREIKSVVLDIGLQPSVKGSKIYAVLKGAIDAGLTIPNSPDILPSDGRIKGKHIVDYAQKLKKEDKKRYKKQFSKTVPEKIPELFEEVKSNIIKC